ncbi:flavin-containing monooxygenase [Acinetobacter sp. MB5]|uniref:flavin-containing monooxygenase n=1 Tax=Acinetobacter sp. MB5 TaxID=2069438 RepID=UPI000DCFFBD4|nr:NAD(P)/FAD-dependent oxidoreductase [Acinetobacter sp. MB5]
MEHHVDVLIIGAGISGIGAAVHLQQSCPELSFKILERRSNIGGTWDLFRYPGIRSDSDMSTLSYQFYPWLKSQTLADGQAIQDYLEEVVDHYDLSTLIEFEKHVKAANYDTQSKYWRLHVANKEQCTETWQARFLISCTGYYDYDQGYLPKFPQQDNFQGLLIHPQHWPADLNYQNKNVVVIGSGATAVTLVPALVKTGARHVTLLQRSPSYVAKVSAQDSTYQFLHRHLSAKWAYRFVRGRNILLQRIVFQMSESMPKLTKRLLLNAVAQEVQGKVDMHHFTPNYAPWDQRLCAVPDGDLFQVLREGAASIVTDHIECFTASGIQLKSGKYLPADLIVAATGLQIQLLGGLKLTIDHQPVKLSEKMLYQGVLLSDVPNFALMMGYSNASWTLKVDIAAQYVCQLLKYMRKHHYKEVVAHTDFQQRTQNGIMGKLSSGYLKRATDIMPKQGKRLPWRISHNYLLDKFILKYASFRDKNLSFRD